MINQRVVEASNLLRQAQVALDDINRIEHTTIQQAAVEGAKPLVERLVELALAELARA